MIVVLVETIRKMPLFDYTTILRVNVTDEINRGGILSILSAPCAKNCEVRKESILL